MTDGESMDYEMIPGLVSIMIPTYNRPEFFQHTLNSALLQTYKNIEIIVCDNSTEDSTEGLMHSYVGDSRVRYYRNRDAKSKEENFIPFKSLARGEYLQWLMDDDLLAEDKLEKMVACFQQNQGITLVTSRRGIIDENSSWIGQGAENLNIPGECGCYSGRDVARMTLMNAINFIGEPSAVLFRRRDLPENYWRAEYNGYYTISDVAMWMALMEKGDCGIFRDPLSFYRRHGGQEGQQPDVILLSRIEWLELITSYFKRGKFLSKDDYIQAITHLYDDCVKVINGPAEQASAAMLLRFSQAIDKMKDILAKKEI